MDTNDSKPAEASGQACSTCNCNKGCPMVLFALLLMTLGLGLFFFRQARSLNKQVIQTQKYIEEYDKTVAPAGTRFVINLQAFAKNNPDFAAILEKYRIGGVSLNNVQPQPLK